ncbi:NAD(P)H-binding protein, PF13460 family [Leptospira inadai serovar Lyme str. 10]|uniref:NAD(P)H-binding protein, PF13460 family n=2 Tax=Leptospira inadai serovar Lyme TaxID=293084 RepID=V6HT27_9LEPT|nr:SDR family NAD(P)-dependent oxidoreductase [Leptospira inadai]EQA35819.1 NAD(P)H-binding protein, PF13460 family [Leptospira inadai serovar Lyme str. 10]PNV76988.1 3-ketoacyl-ACP reductase [Leptospira inadai serovar Lyme]
MSENRTRKKVIITGASSGIGRELALLYGKSGHDLAVTSRRKKALDDLAKEIKAWSSGGKVITKALDVSDSEQNFKVLPALVKELGGVDLFIANAGISTSSSFGEKSFQADKKVIETNLIGLMAGASALIDDFKKRKSGQIVGISSVASFRGLPGWSSYSASKAGVSTYLEALRGEVRKYGIKVTVIHPGFIDTPINQQMKSRPFVIPVSLGAQKIYDRIESGVRSATVPWFPWVLVGALMKIVPEFFWEKIGYK